MHVGATTDDSLSRKPSVSGGEVPITVLAHTVESPAEHLELAEQPRGVVHRESRTAREFDPDARLSSEAGALLEQHCPRGVPQLAPSWRHYHTRVVARRGYALLHSSVDRIPVFVCQHIEPNTVGGSVQGSHMSFRADPDLPASKRAVDDD